MTLRVNHPAHYIILNLLYKLTPKEDLKLHCISAYISFWNDLLCEKVHLSKLINLYYYYYYYDIISVKHIKSLHLYLRACVCVCVVFNTEIINCSYVKQTVIAYVINNNTYYQM